MLDRASTFADPTIVELLRTRCIPVAIDQAYQRRQKDAEGEFYRRIASQGPRSDFQRTTQGIYIADAAGTLLAYNNNRGPERIRTLLEAALQRFTAPEAEPIESGPADPRYSPTPPEGGAVLCVRAKVLGGYPETGQRWGEIFRAAISRDNAWVTKEEREALARGTFPEALARRLARFHLVDNTRGEPPMWGAEECGTIEMTLEEGTIRGRISLATEDGSRSYDAALLGTVTTREGALTGFTLIARGLFHGEGQYTPGAPPGKFPLAVSFTLSDGSDAADAIPPQASRGWVEGYWR